MRRHSFKQRHFTTKLKHRKKLNAKYDPRNRMRVTFTEVIGPPMTRFLEQWVKHMNDLGDVMHVPLEPEIA